VTADGSARRRITVAEELFQNRPDRGALLRKHRRRCCAACRLTPDVEAARVQRRRRNGSRGLFRAQSGVGRAAWSRRPMILRPASQVLSRRQCLSRSGPVSAGSGGQWGGNCSTAGVYAACMKLRSSIAQEWSWRVRMRSSRRGIFARPVARCRSRGADRASGGSSTSRCGRCHRARRGPEKRNHSSRRSARISSKSELMPPRVRFVCVEKLAVDEQRGFFVSRRMPTGDRFRAVCARWASKLKPRDSPRRQVWVSGSAWHREDLRTRSSAILAFDATVNCRG